MNRVGAIGELRIWYPQVTSTMDVASGLAADGAPHGTVVEAGQQTAGRGRQGRVWKTKAQEALLTSWILRLSCEEQYPSVLSPLVALALIRAIRQVCPDAPAGFKWPNDVLIDERKVAGILLNSRRMNDEVVVIAGIGVNLSRTSAQSVAAAASLGEWTDDICAGDVRDALGNELGSIVSESDCFARLSACHLEELRNMLVWKDEDVEVVTNDTTITGRLVTIVADGSLRLLRSDTGEILSMHVGEIVRGPRKIAHSTA